MSESVMCMNCGGTARRSTTTDVVKFGDSIMITKNTPCYKCEKCGELSYDGSVVDIIQRNAKSNSDKEITITDYSTLAASEANAKRACLA